jgi:hypothetical protein
MVRKLVIAARWLYEPPQLTDLTEKQLWLTKRVGNYIASITQANSKGYTRFVYVVGQAGVAKIDGVEKIVGRRILSGWAGDIVEAKRRADERIIEVQVAIQMGDELQLGEGDIIGDYKPSVQVDDGSADGQEEGGIALPEGREHRDGADPVHDSSEDEGSDLQGE